MPHIPSQKLACRGLRHLAEEIDTAGELAVHTLETLLTWTLRHASLYVRPSASKFLNLDSKKDFGGRRRSGTKLFAQRSWWTKNDLCCVRNMSISHFFISDRVSFLPKSCCSKEQQGARTACHMYVHLTLR